VRGMNLDNVVMEIIDEAERKAKEIEERAKIEREKVISEAKDRIKEKKENMRKETDKRIAQEMTKLLAVARLQAKKLEMDAKKEAVENLYVKFAEKIYTSERKEILKKLLSFSKNIEASTIYVNNNDIKAAKELFKNFNVQEVDIVGGIIVENRDRTEKIDLSLETIIEGLKKETVTEVSGILFGEKNE
jgi:V/A-type H+-transporting ATPase subunit E